LEANNGGNSDIALGSVIGSNICNIALILGIAAMLKPLNIHKQIVKREIPILIIASLAFVAMLWDKQISVLEGVVLTVGIVSYVGYSLFESRKQNKNEEELGEFSAEELAEMKSVSGAKLLLSIGLIIGGLLTLKFGTDWLLVHGEAVALSIGVSEAIIALFLFAFGTSLPELATSVAAIKQGEGDIITGNAIGSCIFNILAVMGITAIVKPIHEVNIQFVDKGVMIGFTLLITVFMCTKMRLNKVEGIILLVGYIAYSTIRYLMDQGISVY